MTNQNFYTQLKHSLPESNWEERKKWATIIIESNYDLLDFLHLAREKHKISTRFLWLLSDVGEQNPTKLFKVLPRLLTLRSEIPLNNMEATFANYWLICGVPEENEAEVITLLFDWLQSPNKNITTKSRSLFVLFNLTKKYPELKNELILCIEDQMHKNTQDFRKRAKKILIQLIK